MCEKEETILKRFDSEIDIYKFHLDIVIKVGLYIFGITGGIVSFVLTNGKFSVNGQFSIISRLSLLIPIILNIGVATTYGLAVSRTRAGFKDHQKTCRQLEIRHFDMSSLTHVCLVLCISFALVAASLFVLMLYADLIIQHMQPHTK